ncbi:MAG: ParB N-terminal domain-containing protein [Proteobacteria bacterium]|nr:ParB N-terminal domain-containing protein [Pseudomonadota bacterium]
MDTKKNIIEIDFHLLDLRYSHTRIQNANLLARMQNSISRYGQIVPALAVAERNTFILIDGYLRHRAMKACGHDCIKLQVVEENEAGALFTVLAKNNDRQWEVIEQASLIQELHSRFTYSFAEIGNRLGRNKSWVKRRLDLVASLPNEIQQAVMTGKVSSWSASHVLVPLSRVNEQDCINLTKKIIADPLSTRELVCLYKHYKKSNRTIRDRIIADPPLFAKTVKQQEEQKRGK